MSASSGHTLVEEETETERAAKETARAAYLLVLLEGERPFALSSRHCLANINTVLLGRGTERQAFRPGVRKHSDLELQIPDLRMSSRHAIMTRVRQIWTIEDCSSKNGTRVNGQMVEQHQLQDGDLIELGRTLLLFKADLPVSSMLDVDADPALLDNGSSNDPVTLLPDFERQLKDLRALAPNKEVSILILGESGTGKEVLARQIAAWSGRTGAFVGVNCGAISETLIESELFGAVKGAYSGASTDRPGLIRSADRGCLFLDEIADLPQASQATLLRVLQEHEVLPVGATKPVKVDLRVLAATHQDLEQAVLDGRFRQDLFARIAGFKTRLPRLRERPVDFGLLIGRLLRRLANGPVRLSPETVRALVCYPWPLHVRELYTCLSAAYTLAGGETIAPVHLPEPVRQAFQLGKGIPPETETSQREVIELTQEQVTHRAELITLLQAHDGNVSAIARETGKARMQVQRWLKRYGLDATEFRERE